MGGALTKCIKLTTTLNQSCVKSSVSLCAGKMSSINVRDKNRSQLWSWTRPYRPSTSQTSFLDGLSKR